MLLWLYNIIRHAYKMVPIPFLNLKICFLSLIIIVVSCFFFKYFYFIFFLKGGYNFPFNLIIMLIINLPCFFLCPLHRFFVIYRHEFIEFYLCDYVRLKCMNIYNYKSWHLSILVIKQIILIWWCSININRLIRLLFI